MFKVPLFDIIVPGIHLPTLSCVMDCPISAFKQVDLPKNHFRTDYDQLSALMALPIIVLSGVSNMALDNAMVTAALSNDEDACKILLQFGASSIAFKYLALRIAVYSGFTQLTNLLLDDAEPDAVSLEKLTLIAIIAGRGPVLDILCEFGAQINPTHVYAAIVNWNAETFPVVLRHINGPCDCRHAVHLARRTDNNVAAILIMNHPWAIVNC